MTVYLVEGHMGGLYVTENPSIICYNCSSCGDSDMIAASWTDNEEKIQVLFEYAVEHGLQLPDSAMEAIVDIDSVDDLDTYLEEELEDRLEWYDNIIGMFAGMTMSYGLPESMIDEQEKNRLLDMGRAALMHYRNETLAGWGIAPYNRETLIDALYSTIRNWEGDKIARNWNAEKMFFYDTEDRRSLSGRTIPPYPIAYTYECVMMRDMMFPGYRRLWENAFGAIE